MDCLTIEMHSNLTYTENHKKIGDLLIIAAYTLASYLLVTIIGGRISLTLSTTSMGIENTTLTNIFNILREISFVAFFAIAAYISIKCRANFPSTHNIFLTSAILWAVNTLMALTRTIMLIATSFVQAGYVLSLPVQILSYVEIVVMLIALGGWYYSFKLINIKMGDVPLSFKRMNFKIGDIPLIIAMPMALLAIIVDIVIKILYSMYLSDSVNHLNILIVLNLIKAAVFLILTLVIAAVTMFLVSKGEGIREAVIAEKRFKTLVKE